MYNIHQIVVFVGAVTLASAAMMEMPKMKSEMMEMPKMKSAWMEVPILKSSSDVRSDGFAYE